MAHARSRSEHLAKFGGTALSADEYESGLDGLDDTDLDISPGKFVGAGKPEPDDDKDDKEGTIAKGGKVDMSKLLCDLLRALGIEVNHTGGEEEFKRALYDAALAKVMELTGNGVGQGQVGTPGKGKVTNPLMPGSNMDPNNPMIQTEQSPMFMSLNLAAIGDDNLRGLALSLAVEAENQQRRRATDARAVERGREGNISHARGLRQERINKILKVAPHLRGQIDLAAHAPSAAFSCDQNYCVRDGMDGLLSKLERDIAAEQQRLAAPPTTVNEAAAVAALSRAMGQFHH